MSISEMTGIPRPTVLRKLNKFLKKNFLIKDKSSLYRINDKSNFLMRNPEWERKTVLETTTRGKKSTTETSQTHFETETISKASRNPNDEHNVYKSKKKKSQNNSIYFLG